MAGQGDDLADSMIKLGGFVFSKRPDIFRTRGGLGSGKFFLAGSVADSQEWRGLSRALQSSLVLDFAEDERTTQVIVTKKVLSTDAVWGFCYELSLKEYKATELMRTKLSNGQTENFGEEMLSARFRIEAQIGESVVHLPIRDIPDYDFDIRVRLTKEKEVFRVKFEDQHILARNRRDFSSWIEATNPTAEIFLGYLQSGYLSVAKGNVARIKHGLRASGTWLAFEGTGGAHTRPQVYDYHLVEGKNIFRISQEKISEGGILVRVTTPLIPDLKPGDEISISRLNPGPSTGMQTVNCVDHLMSRLKGAQTRISYVRESDSCYKNTS